MIQIVSICQKIDDFLREMKNHYGINDYRIYLRTNESLVVYIKCNNNINKEALSASLKELYARIKIEYVYDDEDNFYESVFAENNRIILNTGRRRLNSLFSKNVSVKHRYAPVITFYSYKGGMGRSTTLASFAIYLSLKQKKNVFIVDCDLEAPGFNNFFLKNPAENNQQQGFIEYVMDKGTGLTMKDKLNLYCSEVGHEFSGEGAIRVMHAGNLNTEKLSVYGELSRNDLDDYVEGLSRLDLVHSEYALKVFMDLFEDITDVYSPDVILIDSKTGISDVMGLTVCSISDMVVGFFRNDTQSLPGLYYFIKTMVEKNDVEPYVVNSILPFSRERRTLLFEHFKSKVRYIINEIDEDSDFDFPCFSVYRNEDLEVIGTSAENVTDLAEVILNDEYKPYKDLFEALSIGISQKNDKLKGIDNKGKMLPMVNSNTNENDDFSKMSFDPVKIDGLSVEERNGLMIKCKNYILEKTYKAINAIDLYADNVSIAKELKEHRFFYRSCMSDLFNPDKYMILGSKGTGKSYLYSTLRSPEGVEYLQKRSNHDGDDAFIYTIDKIDRIFHVYRLSDSLNMNEIYRFWLIYTWNSIVDDVHKRYPDFKLSEDLEVFPIIDNQTTTSVIELRIKDANYVQKIEYELQRLDDYLSTRSVDCSLTIVYDQLDEIVNPMAWNKWIPALIDMWRNKKYANIYGKLFVRKDLFRSLVGLTNKKDVENKAVDIEWSKEEIYSYFFKVIFSEFEKDVLWTYMCLAGYDKVLIKQCKNDYARGKEQFRLDDYILRHLVDTFFGKQVDTGDSSRMGTSYDWFYKNLKNADDSISLRPYIELLKQAMKLRIQGVYSEEETTFPILYQKYYTNRDVRKEAVKRHYQDLVEGTIGNKPIEYIFEFISNHGKYKYVSMSKSKFEDMLANTLKYNQDKEEMKDMSVEQLKSLLITNGIVKEDNYGRGTIYVFSFLYKYMLGLRKA